jgi:hypothetical protein
LGQGIKENGGGVSLTKIDCKHFCKCHNVPPVQQQYGNFKLKKPQYLWKHKENYDLYEDKG